MKLKMTEPPAPEAIPTYRTPAKKAQDLKFILHARGSGIPYEEIAEALHIRPATVYRDEQAALAELAKQNEGKTTEMRALIHRRLEHFLFKLQTRIESGNLEAIREGVKINAAISKLYALDVQPVADWRMEAAQYGVNANALVDFFKQQLRNTGGRVQGGDGAGPPRIGEGGDEETSRDAEGGTADGSVDAEFTVDPQDPADAF